MRTLMLQVLSLVAVLVLPAALAGCEARGGNGAPAAQRLGDAERGRRLARQYGCHTCHVIPGVRGAGAEVGPPLDRFKHRVYAGGQLNAPDHLVRFLQDPHAVDPHSPMPRVGVTAEDAWDLAAFLYTLD